MKQFHLTYEILHSTNEIIFMIFFYEAFITPSLDQCNFCIGSMKFHSINENFHWMNEKILMKMFH